MRQIFFHRRDKVQVVQGTGEISGARGRYLATAMYGTEASSTTFQPASNHIIKASFLPIAIIGSSYAGLTFANILQRHSIPFILFDSKSPPYTYVSGGSKFNIPSYEFIAKELDIEFPYQHNDDDRPTREDVIESLLVRVRTNLVNSRRVVKIERRGGDGGNFYLHTILSTHAVVTKQKSQHHQYEPTMLYGPYQSVVGADGVYSTVQASAFPGTYIIGDARWVSERWYDLGLQRINRGADMALIDGYELGQATVIMRSNGGCMRGRRNGADYDFNATIAFKFSAYEIFRRRIKRRLSVLVVFIAIITMNLQRRIYVMTASTVIDKRTKSLLSDDV